MDNEQVVNNSEESTSQSPSPSDVQTPDNSNDTLSDQSREDTNTPDNANDNENSVEHDEPQSDKARNRFQDLANENAALKEQKTNWEQDKQRWTELEMQMQQANAQRQVDPYNNNYAGVQEAKTLILESKLQRLEEERGWEQAFSKYPELKKDRDLDDLVYQQYNAAKLTGKNVTPSEVTEQVMRWKNKNDKRVSNESYEQAENDIAEKSTVSQRSGRRSGSNSGSNKSNADSAMDMYKQTGDDRYLLDSLKY